MWLVVCYCYGLGLICCGLWLDCHLDLLCYCYDVVSRPTGFSVARLLGVVVWFLGFGFADCFGVLISCGFLCFEFVVLVLCDLTRVW